jgi:hypothetical protein
VAGRTAIHSCGSGLCTTRPLERLTCEDGAAAACWWQPLWIYPRGHAGCRTVGPVEATTPMTGSARPRLGLRPGPFPGTSRPRPAAATLAALLLLLFACTGLPRPADAAGTGTPVPPHPTRSRHRSMAHPTLPPGWACSHHPDADTAADTSGPVARSRARPRPETPMHCCSSRWCHARRAAAAGVRPQRSPAPARSRAHVQHRPGLGPAPYDRGPLGWCRQRRVGATSSQIAVTFSRPMVSLAEPAAPPADVRLARGRRRMAPARSVHARVRAVGGLPHARA